MLAKGPHVYDGVQSFWSSLNAEVMIRAQTTHIPVFVAVILPCLLQCDAFGSWSYAQMDNNLPITKRKCLYHSFVSKYLQFYDTSSQNI